MTLCGPPRTLVDMNIFLEAQPFVVRDFVAQELPFKDDDAAAAEAALLERLEALEPGGLIPLDFSRMRIGSAAARRLLRRPLLRISGGELEDRYVVLGDLGDSQYSVDVMLEGEKLVAIERSDEGPQLRGGVDPAVQATYSQLLRSATMTASELQDSLGLTNISTATNRLTNLARLGLSRRVEQRPASGGGREYVYAAVR